MSVEVVVTDDRIQVEMRGLDQLWAFARDVTIPLATVQQATVVEAVDAKARLRWRLLGTGVPRVVIAGRFSVKSAPGEREFWVTHRGQQFLQIETTNPKLRRVVLEVTDSEQLAATLNSEALRWRAQQ